MAMTLGSATLTITIIGAAFAGIAAFFAIWSRLRRVSVQFDPRYLVSGDDPLSWKALWTVASANVRPVRVEEVGVVFSGGPSKVYAETTGGGHRLPLTVEDGHVLELRAERRSIVEAATRCGHTAGRVRFRAYAEKASLVRRRCYGGRWTLDFDRNYAVEPLPPWHHRLWARTRSTLHLS
jgi:hypothetical protein